MWRNLRKFLTQLPELNRQLLVNQMKETFHMVDKHKITEAKDKSTIRESRLQGMERRKASSIINDLTK